MSKILVFVVLFFSFSCASTLWGDELKARMSARMPQLIELKKQGVIGENNRGFLEFRPGHSPKGDLVASENEDRRRFYEKIAAHEKISPAAIGKRHAERMMREAHPGVWIQTPDGQWRKK